jgi:hypothetical protein
MQENDGDVHVAEMRTWFMPPLWEAGEVVQAAERATQ